MDFGFEINRDSLEITGVLGEGAFGIVKKAKVLATACGVTNTFQGASNDYTTVAVKMIKGRASISMFSIYNYKLPNIYSCRGVRKICCFFYVTLFLFSILYLLFIYECLPRIASSILNELFTSY